MEPSIVPHSAAAALAAFFAGLRAARHPALRGPVARVHRHLEVYLDTEAERWLTTPELALVEAERQLDPAGAVARVTGPDALVATLPGFVHRDWLLPRPADARLQVFLTDLLLRWLIEARLVDRTELACSVLEVEVAVTSARALLDRAGPLSAAGPPGPAPPAWGP